MQLDPDLDVFGIARPYVQRALAEQFSPAALSAQATRTARHLGQVALELPQQLSDTLARLVDGELRLQTREAELRRVAGALIGAANRLALALVLAALILGMGLVAIAVGIGGWSGLVPTLLLGAGGVALVGGLLLLGLALLRGRE
jgi:ubiquinone biosynthesis protein